jgi:hypothetical protein
MADSRYMRIELSIGDWRVVAANPAGPFQILQGNTGLLSCSREHLGHLAWMLARAYEAGDEERLQPPEEPHPP